MLGFLNLRKCTRHVNTYFRAFDGTAGRGSLSVGCQSDEDIRRFITENTEIVAAQSLTPEVRLRLFTPNCRFWREKPELWPFGDPYWAIYWPGGQALSR